jgi:hypothetical protein
VAEIQTPPGAAGPAPGASRNSKRIWLILAGSILGLCVLSCVALFALGVPAIREGLHDEIEEAVATEVARQIPAPPEGTAEPGEYTITESSLQDSLKANLQDEEGRDEDVFVDITTVHIEVGVVSRGQSATYTGVPVAENGELVLRDVESSSRFLSFLLPADDFAEAIEDAVNGYLADNNLSLAALTLTDDGIVLTTVAAGT